MRKRVACSWQLNSVINERLKFIVLYMLLGQLNCNTLLAELTVIYANFMVSLQMYHCLYYR